MDRREQLLQILDLARWAPSGDNTQPWRFEILADDRIAIHGHDTRDWCLYDFDGHASHMAHGALLETLRIAASAHRLQAVWQRRAATPASAPIYDVTLSAVADLAPDALLPFIERRAVQRRPMARSALDAAQRRALRDAVGEGYRLRFFETAAQKRAMAVLLWKSAGLRLNCPEAYEVHRRIIEWGARYSLDRIPAQAVGVDPLTAALMRWVMGRWERVAFFNRFLFGTVLPRVQLDLLPAFFCAAHVLVEAAEAPRRLEDHVRAGEAMQRLWLTAEALDLRLQPEMTPLIFRWYARHRPQMSREARINTALQTLAAGMDAVLGAGGCGVFLCRIGRGAAAQARSLRRPLTELMQA